ncbi:PKD domain-containing protein [Dyadobacter koreensis]|uniref:PKD domain-containing protein n=1 Tax=Dyadobacter koreensis TaxID=408657 RepID=A0A1H6WL35_9BACT|nr:PKD domain-containing protein [Dyadobacter koreensis]SEJ16446.1 PKD domain-containing protein [Dyadobacter koreensis]
MNILNYIRFKVFSIGLLYSISLLLILFSCSKKEPQPVISFSIEYGKEGMVIFKVNSSNAENFYWDLGDGHFNEIESPTHIYSKNGTYNVSVTAKGKGGEITVTQQVIVKNILGSVMFWMNSKGESDIAVSIDNFGFIGNIEDVNSQEPECGNGFATTFSQLSEGEHTYKAKEIYGANPKEWAGTVIITGGLCLKKQLTY